MTKRTPIYDSRTGEHTYKTDFSALEEGSFRDSLATSLAEDSANSLLDHNPKGSFRRYLKEEAEGSNKNIMSAKESLTFYLKEVSADKEKINYILSDLSHLDAFKTYVMDREDVNSLSLDELKDLFSEHLEFFDIELEKSGFYHFAGRIA